MNLKKKILTNFLLFFLILNFAQAKIVLINSKDWKDVYYGILYAHSKNLPVYFANSPNPAGIFNILPTDKDVELIESFDPFIPNLESLLKTRGYSPKVIKIKEAWRELMPERVENVFLVEEDFPVNTIITAPLAILNKSWVIIVGEDNADSVLAEIKNKRIFMVGLFKRKFKLMFAPISEKIFEEGSKFKLSLILAEEFLKKKPTTQVIISDGKYLESELLRGYSPVLLVGENLLPIETLNFILRKGVKTVVAIGPQLTYVGEKIRERTNKTVSVFIKFGQALPGGPIYGLTMFPLPETKLALDITSASFDPEQGLVKLVFENKGNVGLFAMTTFRVVNVEGEEVGSSGDKFPLFIAAGETLAKFYNISVKEGILLRNLTIEIYTSFGETPENLDRYLTAGGAFGPPLTLSLKMEKLRAEGINLLIKKVKYVIDKGFRITVENPSQKEIYVIVKMLDVKVGGIEKHVSSQITKIKSLSSKEIPVNIKLEEEDIKENEKVRIIVDYGTSPNFFAYRIMRIVEVEVVKPIPNFVWVVIIVLIIFLFLFLWRKS